MNELSTCRPELKKLAKILVGSDLNIFPLCKDHAQAFQDQPALEIHIIATRLEKAQAKAKSNTLFHNPDHVRNSVFARLAQFAYLNDPPTVTMSAGLFPCYSQLDHSTG